MMLSSKPSSLGSATGTLLVTLKRASHLKNVNVLGIGQDPYASISIYGRMNESQRSRTAGGGGRSPQWHETFTFSGVTCDDTLVIMLRHENRLFADKEIGACRIPLRSVAVSGVELILAPVITKNNVCQGTVQVQLYFALQGQAPCMLHIPRKLGGWILPTYGGRDCWQHYRKEAFLARGTFGSVWKAVNIASGEGVAIKVISKKSVTSDLQIGDIRREVQILHHLAGHPNVVGIKDVFEDVNDVCIAMEFCSGGQLLDALKRQGRFSECHAAAVMRALVGVVAHCHSMGVIHRDIKLENFLISNDSLFAVLKTADFGLSTFFQEGQVFSDIAGTPDYLAPEVVHGAYGKEADLWSCGVVLYVLLSGRLPFRASRQQQWKALHEADIDFTSEPWPQVSGPAMDVVKRLLTHDPKKRATAAEILKHDWMRAEGCAMDVPMQPEVFARIKEFSSMNRLKQEALKVIAASLPNDVVAGADQMFLEMDQDGSGTITVQEFVDACKRKGKEVAKGEANVVFKNADTDGNGKIDKDEFRAATLSASQRLMVENLQRAFQQFDRDGDGVIDKRELRHALASSKGGKKWIEQIMNEADKDGNGQISWEEFVEMMVGYPAAIPQQ